MPHHHSRSMNKTSWRRIECWLSSPASTGAIKDVHVVETLGARRVNAAKQHKTLAVGSSVHRVAAARLWNCAKRRQESPCHSRQIEYKRGGAHLVVQALATKDHPVRVVEKDARVPTQRRHNTARTSRSSIGRVNHLFCLLRNEKEAELCFLTCQVYFASVVLELLARSTEKTCERQRRLGLSRRSPPCIKMRRLGRS